MKINSLFVIICLFNISIYAQNYSDGTSKKNINYPKPLSTNLNNSEANIKHQIPSPVGLVLDIAFDGSDLWIAGFEDSFYYKIDPFDGAILKTIPTNGNNTPRGLTFDGNNLWVINSSEDLIFKIDTIDGTVIDTFSTPTVSNNFPTGLAWDGKYLWHLDAIDGNAGGSDSMRLFKMDTFLNVLKFETINIDGNAGGLTFANGNLWYTDNGTDTFNEIDTINFDLIQECEAPGGNFPNGLTFDGEYLWLANGHLDSLYQIDINKTSTGLNNYNSMETSDFLIYPNPSTDFIFIKTENFLGSAYFISDINGKIISRGKLKKEITKINVSPLSPGTYLLSLNTQSGETYKLIKK